MKLGYPGATLDRWGRLSDSAPPVTAQYVGFGVGAEKFGLPLLRLAEVRTLHDTALVLFPPDFRTGRAALHGQLVPLLDLRVELGHPAGFGRDTRVVFAWRHLGHQSASLVGLIVDEVQGLGEVGEAELEPVLEHGEARMPGAVLCLVSEVAGGRVIVDLDHWLTP